MRISIYQIDAFTSRRFGGNPAAVCPLEDWLPDEVMQSIAIENNLAETAFFVPKDSSYHLRWFTPEFEIDLCGHATLATAHVIWKELNEKRDKIVFKTMSGDLSVVKRNKLLEMDFPSRPAVKSTLDTRYLEAFSIQPKEVFKSRDFMLVYEREDDIRLLSVNANLLDSDYFNKGGIICTAKGNEVDFVSRSFWPGASVFEDPVTGSAHCTLVPYWSEQLGKSEMKAQQLSKRLGDLSCKLKGDRVLIAGEAVTYLEGVIEV